MHFSTRARLRDIFHRVREGITDIDEAIEELIALAKGVKPPPPDDTGTPILRP